MKVGIIGFPQSGKKTIFEALMGCSINSSELFKDNIVTVKVPDLRLDKLANIYQSENKVNAKIKYFLPGKNINDEIIASGKTNWNKVKNCDALIHVIKNFSEYSNEKSLISDFNLMNQDLVFLDFLIVDKRLKYLKQEMHKGVKVSDRELFLLDKCLICLEKEEPLRKNQKIVLSKFLKGYSFLSAKPLITLLNSDYENYSDDLLGKSVFNESICVEVRGRLEKELAIMGIEEAKNFFSEFKIKALAINKLINASYAVLDLISFFTAGPKEVKAWTIKSGTVAVDAAKVIHSDIYKGFICVEHISYKDLMESKSYVKAKTRGLVKLEGKKYKISDGDILNFRFNL